MSTVMDSNFAGFVATNLQYKKSHSGQEKNEDIPVWKQYDGALMQAFHYFPDRNLLILI